MGSSMYRQGDLLFCKVESIPSDVKVSKNGVIARGEVTGHTHRLSDGAKAVLLFSTNAVAYIRALEKTEVVHDEHGSIFLPAGEYAVKRQREYRPNGWVQVAD